MDCAVFLQEIIEEIEDRLAVADSFDGGKTWK